jgi:hypothetical protein
MIQGALFTSFPEWVWVAARGQRSLEHPFEKRPKLWCNAKLRKGIEFSKSRRKRTGQGPHGSRSKLLHLGMEVIAVVPFNNISQLGQIVGIPEAENLVVKPSQVYGMRKKTGQS